MPGGEVNNPMRTIRRTTIINSNIDIRKINWEIFILLIEKCNLCAVYLLFFDETGWERACVTIRVQSIFFFFFFYPAISWPSQITLRLPGCQTTPETERGKINRKKREKECRAGKTDASSDAEIWQVVVRQRSVQIQTQDLVGVRVCACVCVRESDWGRRTPVGGWW